MKLEKNNMEQVKTIQYRKELPQLMKELGLPMIAAEVGVAEGFFSRDLLAEGIELLYSIDYWDHIPGIAGDGNQPKHWHQKNFHATKERLKPFGLRSIILKGKSKDMAEKVPDDTLGLLYIDCDHSYYGVISDLITWESKVVNGGIIAGHDFINPAYQVKQAVEDFCRGKYSIHVIPEDKEVDAGFYFIKQ